MKILLLLLLIISCGKKSEESVNLRELCLPDSQLVGEWQDGDLFNLNLDSNCFGYHQECDMNFTYYKPAGGKILIDVEVSNNATGCPANGENTCDFEYVTEAAGDYLSLDCGSGNTIYLK